MLDYLYWRKPQYWLDDTNYFKDSAGNHSSTVTLVRTNDSTKRERGKDRGRENLHSQKCSKATHDRQDEEAVWSGEISEPQSSTFLEWRHLLCHVPYLQPSQNPTKSRVPIFRDFQFENMFTKPSPKILCSHILSAISPRDNKPYTWCGDYLTMLWPHEMQASYFQGHRKRGTSSMGSTILEKGCKGTLTAKKKLMKIGACKKAPIRGVKGFVLCLTWCHQQSVHQWFG